jgi:asparagine synthase (glutamine-hydrolysing)
MEISALGETYVCGIAGFLSVEDGIRIPADIVSRVLDSMEKRGPDASGLWEHADSGALMLHRRLSIQDLSEFGAQPMHSNDRNLSIVFNGEIYNKEELRTLTRDYRYRGTSDTEVIIALFEKYGIETPRLLRGMYAFAIWDERRQGLFLARDPYGIKPLYFASTPKGIWYASQVKTLLQVPEVDLAPEPAGHAAFFLWGNIREPYTLYKGIRSLRSGHYLWLQRGQNPREVEFASIAGALAESMETDPPVFLREALSGSVCAHFLSDVPVSVFLSAGLDSSTILAISATAFPAASLNCLTLGFDECTGTVNDETTEAAHIARHYGTNQRVQIIGRSDFAKESQNFLDAMDQPSVDGINTYFIARLAREAGFKVALSGIGGDELFGGYPSFSGIPRLVNALKKFPASHRWGAALRRWSEPLLKRFTSPKYAGTIEYGGSVQGAYLLRRALFMPWELPEAMDQDLAEAGLDALFESEFEQRELNRVRELPMRAQVCFLESTLYMRDRLLRDADWAGMAHSVEIRTPLVDFTLLRQLAPFLRSSNPPGKQDMANTPAKPLPESILRRKKTGFFVPVREWMMDSFAQPPERGLRSWAKFVYRNQWETQTAALHHAE